MSTDKETEIIIAEVVEVIEEYKKDNDLVRQSDQLLTFDRFKETFAYELQGRTDYEKAIAFSFFVSMVTNKKIINRLRSKYGNLPDKLNKLGNG